MSDRHASCRRKLLFIARVLFTLLCLAYNLYLLWLLAYLKDNRNYWFLSLLVISITLACTRLFSIPSLSVSITVMICFTMLSRLPYYHRHQDDFIGPRFVIASLKLRKHYFDSLGLLFDKRLQDGTIAEGQRYGVSSCV